MVVKTLIDEIDELNWSLTDADHLLYIERSSRQAAETEHERLLHNKTAAREVSKAENVAKDEFLAMLRHELRNPLAAISGATQLCCSARVPTTPCLSIGLASSAGKTST